MKPTTPEGILLLERVAPLLESLDVVYVGGATVPTFVSAPAEVRRPTKDVDAYVVAHGYHNDAALAVALRRLGLRHDTSPDAPTCRWLTDDGIQVDIMTLADPFIVTNGWYDLGVETAVLYELPSGRTIRRLAPEVFILTKLEAWRSRGDGDWQKSRDLEDIVTVSMATPDLEERFHGLDPGARRFAAEILADLEARIVGGPEDLFYAHAEYEDHDTPDMLRALYVLFGKRDWLHAD